MKKSLLFIFSAFVFTTSCGDSEKNPDGKTELEKEKIVILNSTMEELGASVILSLKMNDSTMLFNLLPVKEDVEQIVSTYTGSEDDKKSILDGADENTKKISSNTYESFSEIKEKGNNIGIKWKDVVFANVEYTMTNENNIEAAEAEILFTHKETTYKIYISECIKTSHGWLIFDKPQWKGEIK